MGKTSRITKRAEAHPHKEVLTTDRAEPQSIPKTIRSAFLEVYLWRLELIILHRGPQRVTADAPGIGLTTVGVNRDTVSGYPYRIRSETVPLPLVAKKSQGLRRFLEVECAKLMPRPISGLKGGRSDELHWTADNKNIAHQGRIDSGALGEVHQVRPSSLPKFKFLIVVVQYSHPTGILIRSLFG